MGPEDSSVFEQLGQRELVSRMHAQLDELLVARDQMGLLLRLRRLPRPPLGGRVNLLGQRSLLLRWG